MRQFLAFQLHSCCIWTNAHSTRGPDCYSPIFYQGDETKMGAQVPRLLEMDNCTSHLMWDSYGCRSWFRRRRMKLFARASLRHFWSSVDAGPLRHSLDVLRTGICLWTLTMITLPSIMAALGLHPSLYPWTRVWTLAIPGHWSLRWAPKSSCHPHD
jgi:hypothetical protein